MPFERIVALGHRRPGGVESAAWLGRLVYQHADC
jgi:hypothetical protein